jgi:hypothetical protein
MDPCVVRLTASGRDRRCGPVCREACSVRLGSPLWTCVSCVLKRQVGIAAVDLCTCDSRAAPLGYDAWLPLSPRLALPCWLCWLGGHFVAGVAAGHLSLAGFSSLPCARMSDDRCHSPSDSCSSLDGWPAALRWRWVVTQLLRRYLIRSWPCWPLGWVLPSPLRLAKAEPTSRPPQRGSDRAFK